MADTMNGTIWRHKARGTTYMVVVEGTREANMEPCVAYVALMDGKVWLRPTEEFLDGRFEAVTPVTASVFDKAKPSE
jgi:hypothetical protein